VRTIKGIFLLEIEDTRGYTAYAQIKNSEIMIGSGCRYFTVNEAIEHWGNSYTGIREQGDNYLAGILKLNDCCRFKAWLETEKVQK
jgi:hypothetical protein